MLRLTPALHDELAARAARAYPEEGCGLLMGRMDGPANVASALFPVPNRWGTAEERRRRFRITGDDLLRAELAAAQRGLEVVGVYHSHPDCEAVASRHDLAWAAWCGYSYLITEVRGGRPAGSRSWQLLPDRSGFVEEVVVEG